MTTPPVYPLLLLAVILLTMGQILQKIAVDRCRNGSSGIELVINIGRRPEIWVAVGCLGAGMLAWLLVLRIMDVSKAFPFLSIGQVLVLLVARFYFHERLPMSRWLGALMVIAGVGLVAGT